MFWFIISIFLLFFTILFWQSSNTKRYEKKVLSVLSMLLSQTVRWAYSSVQDSNPLVKLVHANYSNSYLVILKEHLIKYEISRNDFRKLSGTNLDELERKILSVQKNAMIELLKNTKNCIKVDENNLLSKMMFSY